MDKIKSDFRVYTYRSYDEFGGQVRRYAIFLTDYINDEARFYSTAIERATSYDELRERHAAMAAAFDKPIIDLENNLTPYTGLRD
jgi:hypothetical protein